MSLQQGLTEVKNDLQVMSADAIKPSLQFLAQIPKQQIAANASLMKKQLPHILDTLKENIHKNKMNISEQMNVAESLNKFSSHLSKQLKDQYGKQIQNVIKQYRKQQKQQNIVNSQNNQISDIQNQIFKKAAVDPQSDIPIVVSDFTLNDTNNLSGIQQSLEQFRPLLSTPTSMISQSQIPSSVKFLTNYARLLNKNPIGSITGSQGSCFIGGTTMQIGGQSITTQFEKNKIMKTNLPNIGIQLQYHANKTINSWNSFVKNEAKLVNFVKSVNSRQNRMKYVEKQFQNLTQQTFAAQTLATLTYYYIYLPLQIYSRTPNSQGSYNQFMHNYISYTNNTTNPLLLNKDESRALISLLLNVNVKTQDYKKPTELLTSVEALLRGYKKKINQTQIYKVINHDDQRRTQAQAFFKASGMDVAVYGQLMESPNFKGIKTVKFVMPSGLQNNDYINIVNKITNEAVMTNTFKNTWSMYWGSSSLWAYDYIWGQSHM